MEIYANKKILIAEDDTFLADICQTKIENEGATVVVAGDGEETMKKLKEEEIDLLLLDIVMPKKSGLEVLKEMKVDESLKDIPVIIISNLGLKEEVEKGLKLGADEYIVKANSSMEDIVRKILLRLSQRS